MGENFLAGLLLLVAASISSILALLTARRAHASTAAPPLVLFLLSLAWWSGTYALHWLPVPRPSPWFWLDVTYIGVVGVPASFLVFALQFTHHHVSRRMMLLLAIQPLLTLLLLFTDPGDGLFFAGTRAAVEGAIQTGGPAFWGNLIYSYIVIITSILIFLRAFHRSTLARRQIGVVLLGILVSVVINLISVTPLNPFTELDPTSFSFTVLGMALAWSLFRYRLLDVLPVARHHLVERMRDGVLVVDVETRLVDINPAACTMLGIDAGVTGQPMGRVLPHLASKFDRSASDWESIDELVLSDRCLEVQVVPLHGRSGRLSGRLMILRDITARKQAEEQLRAANGRLEQQLEEIARLHEQLHEQATRDGLTGLFNRRYFDETLARELAAAQRSGQPVALVLLDVDHFKRVNDTYGHAVGDDVLKALAALLLADTRTGDVVARYGGEEFVVLLPGTTWAHARQRADAWRQAFADMTVTSNGTTVSTTMSLGVVAWPTHGRVAEDLLRTADQALYAAKISGRDRIGELPAASSAT